MTPEFLDCSVARPRIPGRFLHCRRCPSAESRHPIGTRTRALRRWASPVGRPVWPRTSAARSPRSPATSPAQYRAIIRAAAVALRDSCAIVGTLFRRSPAVLSGNTGPWGHGPARPNSPCTAQEPLQLAEGEGFEPSKDENALNGFRDRPVQPLRHPSAGKASEAGELNRASPSPAPASSGGYIQSDILVPWILLTRYEPRDRMQV